MIHGLSCDSLILQFRVHAEPVEDAEARVGTNPLCLFIFLVTLFVQDKTDCDFSILFSDEHLIFLYVVFKRRSVGVNFIPLIDFLSVHFCDCVFVKLNDFFRVLIFCPAEFQKGIPFAPDYAFVFNFIFLLPQSRAFADKSCPQAERLPQKWDGRSFW